MDEVDEVVDGDSEVELELSGWRGSTAVGFRRKMALKALRRVEGAEVVAVSSQVSLGEPLRPCTKTMLSSQVRPVLAVSLWNGSTDEVMDVLGAERRGPTASSELREAEAMYLHAASRHGRCRLDTLELQNLESTFSVFIS